MKCKQCGKEFPVSPSLLKKGKGKYCGKPCYSKAQSEKEQYRGKNHPRWDRVTYVCQNCGTVKEVKRSHASRSNAKYCSDKCKYEARSREEVSLICEYCGVNFKRSACDVDRGRDRYCCPEHAWKDLRGQKSHLWKGGRPLIECGICGTTFREYTGMGKKYCCTECRLIAMSRPRPGRRTGKYLSCLNCGKEIYRSGVYLSASDNHFCDNTCHAEWVRSNRIDFTCKICGAVFPVIPSRIRSSGNPVYCGADCRNKDPDFLERLRLMNFSQQHSSPNKLELAGYSILDEIGVDYIAQCFLEDRYTVDTYLPDCKLVVEFDGDYWHGNPAKYHAAGAAPETQSEKLRQLNKVQLNHMRLDKSRNTFFKNRDYTVLRFWESDVKTNPDEVRSKILAAVEEAALITEGR